MDDLDHICKPDLSTPASEYSSFPRYKAALDKYAQDENVFMKLSGAFNEFEPKPTPADPLDLLETLRPYLDHVHAVFGAERLMFGSDWPVCNVGGPKGESEGEESNWSIWRSVIARWAGEKGLSTEESEYIWWKTGATAYGIEGFAGSGESGGTFSTM